MEYRLERKLCANRVHGIDHENEIVACILKIHRDSHREQSRNGDFRHEIPSLDT